MWKTIHSDKKTSRTSVIAGWVPDENINHLISTVKQITSNRCYIEVSDSKSIKMEGDVYLIMFCCYNAVVVLLLHFIVKGCHWGAMDYKIEVE